MKKIFETIWDTALPYQDQRDDDGHARVSLAFAKELINREGGDEAVILPAIILHDVGYSQIPRERRMLIFDRNASKEQRHEVALEHQREGVRLAGELLKQLAYPEEMIPEILEIISEHDTRKGFISQNEGLVRDADKLWRFSAENFALPKSRDIAFRKEMCERLEKDLENPDYLYSASAREMARNELAARRKETGI